MELFYPIHYKIGTAIEDALRAGALTRKQVAILWLIRSEGEGRRAMRRKDILRLLGTWFEARNPTITKVLRAMSRAPLNLLEVLDDPRSGREKQVVLTPKGERFLVTMVEAGRKFLRPFIAELSAQEAREGLRFLENITAIHERLLGPAPSRGTVRVPAAPAPRPARPGAARRGSRAAPRAR